MLCLPMKALVWVGITVFQRDGNETTRNRLDETFRFLVNT